MYVPAKNGYFKQLNMLYLQRMGIELVYGESDSSYARPFSVHSGIAWVQYQFTHHYSLFKEPATHCPHPGVKPFKTISIVAWRVNSLPLPSTTMCLIFVSINKNIFGNLGVDSSVSVTCVPQIWQANPLIISRNKHADIHTWIYLIRFDSHIKHRNIPWSTDRTLPRAVVGAHQSQPGAAKFATVCFGPSKEWYHPWSWVYHLVSKLT